jgi:hypothetical protein
LNARTLAALARWHLGRLATFDAIAACALGFLLGVACAWSPFGERSAAALVAFSGAVFAIAFASSPGAVRSARSLFLFSAPLYGRELARGLALAPSLLALLFPLAACAGWSFARQLHPSDWLLPIVCALVATLIALSATLRETWRAALYRTLALCTAAALTALSLLARDDAASHVAVALLALPLGFFALRAFGETLARYDPLTDI